LNGVRVVGGSFELKGDVSEQIDLADQHHVAGAKHLGIFARFIVSLGDAQHDDA